LHSENTLENDEARLTNSRGARACRSEFRFDPYSGKWALIAEGRDDRPTNTEENSTSKSAPSVVEFDPRCPFCVGAESETPETVARASYDADDETNVLYEILDRPTDLENTSRPWTVRVFENKYPVFRLNELDSTAPTFSDVERNFERSTDSSPRRFFQNVPSRGRHEVIVDSPSHRRSWSEFNDVEIKLTFRVFRSRLRVLRDSALFAYSFVFKNVGANAGASQRHTHCQLTGMTELPDAIRAELERLRRFERARRARGETRSFWDALLDAELEANERVLYASARFVAYCPYASRFPFQVEICPRTEAKFEDYDDATLDELATLSRDVARALEEVKRRKAPKDPSPLDYNILMKNAPSFVDPICQEGAEAFRPRWVFLPSVVKKAGYEIGSGIDINPIAPETVARLLRETPFF